LTKEETASALDIDSKTLERLIKDGKFPPGVPVTERLVRWLGDDVDAYLHLQSRLRKPGAVEPEPEGE
jgi:predicted DNA-binding transcriptional regulator AlpA